MIAYHISEKYYCFVNGIITTIYCSGIYLANVLAQISQNPSLPTWAWRIPFILGGLLAIAIMIFRKNLTESPDFVEAKKKKKINCSIFSHSIYNWKIILCALLICGICSGCSKFYYTFLRYYLSDVLGLLSLSTAHKYFSICMMVNIIIAPLVGIIADYLGAIRVFVSGLIMFIFMIIINMYCVIQEFISLPLMLLTSLSMKLFFITGYAILFLSVPTNIKYRNLCLGHALGSMIFSGSTPIISMTLWFKTQITLIPFIYLLTFPILALLAIVKIKKIISYNRIRTSTSFILSKQLSIIN